MSDIEKAVAAYQRLGALDFLIFGMALSLGFLIWRIVKTQDKIVTTQDNLFSKMEAMNNSLSVHDRQAQEMSDRIEKGVDCLNTVKTSVAKLEGRLKV